MNRKKLWPSLLAASMVTSLALTACSQEGGDKPAAETKAPSQTAATKTVDPKAKYDPPITATFVRQVSPSMKFYNGDDLDNNVWTRAYKEELGIIYKTKWSAPQDQFAQKMKLAITTNDLPDIFEVENGDFYDLADAGKLADLTEAYEKYASPKLKEWLEADGGQSMKNAKVNGKLMGIPKITNPYSGSPHLWIRQDWLKKLNLSEPKTADDVIKIAEAFAKKDPDGNGKDDTIGLAVGKALQMSPWTGLEGFFNMYHADMSDNYMKDDSGKFMFGVIQPEAKVALEKLAEMYKNGLIDKEFGIKDNTKVMEDLGKNKIGMYFGQSWSGGWPVGQFIKDNPSMLFKAYPIPSVDGKPVKYTVSQPGWGFRVVQKDYKNPEALIKLYNIFIEKMWTGKAEDYKKFGAEFVDGTERVYQGYAPVGIGPFNEGLERYLAIKDAFKTNDTSKLDAKGLKAYEGMKAYRGGDVNKYPDEANNGDLSVWPYFEGVIKNKQNWNFGFNGRVSEAKVQKHETLKKMWIETYTKIIMGAAPLSDFDKLVEDWKKNGGDQILKEITELDKKQ